MNDKTQPLSVAAIAPLVSRWLIKRIQRMRGKAKLNESKYRRKESEFTFHGGFESGYTLGRLSALEDLADELGVEIDDSGQPTRHQTDSARTKIDPTIEQVNRLSESLF